MTGVDGYSVKTDLRPALGMEGTTTVMPYGPTSETSDDGSGDLSDDEESEYDSDEDEPELAALLVEDELLNAKEMGGMTYDPPSPRYAATSGSTRR